MTLDEVDDRFAIPVGEVMSEPLTTRCVCGCPPHPDGFCPCGCSIYEPDNGRRENDSVLRPHQKPYLGQYGGRYSA